MVDGCQPLVEFVACFPFLHFDFSKQIGSNDFVIYILWQTKKYSANLLCGIDLTSTLIF